MTQDILLDAARPLSLLSLCPAYRPSPLARLADGGPLLVKDETGRMGLGAFKALGGVYAVARLLEARLGIEATAIDEMRHAVAGAGITFVCASAGNHGLSVAAGARLFGARARIHLSPQVHNSFAERLREKGAEVARSGTNYEESVAAAVADGEATGAIHLADGSWDGYIEPPRLVMEGYTVIAEEMRRDFAAAGDWPSHVYLQAGVGGLAGAVAHAIRRTWEVQPEIIVVEPEAAPCLKASVAAGRMVTVEGPDSIMGRLDCKTPSLIAFEILAKAADRFVTVSEVAGAAAAMRAKALGFPTTPSGAAGLAALDAEPVRPRRPLVIISEGAVAVPSGSTGPA